MNRVAESPGLPFSLDPPPSSRFLAFFHFLSFGWSSAPRSLREGHGLYILPHSDHCRPANQFSSAEVVLKPQYPSSCRYIATRR